MYYSAQQLDQLSHGPLLCFAPDERPGKSEAI
jgi:hypothetical protein